MKYMYMYVFKYYTHDLQGAQFVQLMIDGTEMSQ